MTVWEVLVSFGIPTLVCSTIVTILMKIWEKKDKKRQAENKKMEEERHKLELLQIEGILATVSLSESMAKAIKTGHANGDMEEALEYVKKKKHEMNDFLRNEALRNIT